MIVWVTGATGQIGLELCRQLQEQSHEVVALGRGLRQEGPWNDWIEWDLLASSHPTRDPSPPDWVFHLAAQTSSYTARNDPVLDVQTNVLGFVRLLQWVSDAPRPPVVVTAGSATEYSSNDLLIVNEAQDPQPTTFYDVAKATQRLYLEQYAREGWIRGSHLHLSNVYGGRSGHKNERGFVNRAISSALQGKPLASFGHGRYVRDFVHVQDCANALIACAANIETTNRESYLIGTGRGTRIRDVLDLVASEVERQSGVRVAVTEVSPPDGLYEIEFRNAIVDSTKFSRATGWRPSVTIEQGIQMMVTTLSRGG